MSEQTQAQRLVADLYRLIEMIEKTPAIADMSCFRYAFHRLLMSVETKAEVAALARAGMRAGLDVDKHQSDKYAGIDIWFGEKKTYDSLSFHVYADREEVCERIVVGTREVTEEVPDPEALAAVPKVVVTKVVEDVEWRCGSILAPEPVAAVTR